MTRRSYSRGALWRPIAMIVLAAALMSACGSAGAPASPSRPQTSAAGPGSPVATPASAAPVAASSRGSASPSALAGGLTQVSFDGSTLGQYLFEVAQNRGFFEQEGLTGTFSQLATNANTAEVVSGHISYTFNAGAQTDSAVAQGASLRTYAVWGVRTTIDLVGQPGLDSLDKLRGGTIVTPGPTTPHEVWTKQLLQQRSPDLLASVKFDHVNATASSSQIALLTSGQVTAGVFSIDNLFKLPANYPVIYDFASESSPFISIGQGLTAQPAYVQSHADQTKAVIRALSKAANYMTTNEAGSAPFIAKIWALNDAQASEVWKAMSIAWTGNPVPSEQQLENALSLDKVVIPKMANLTLDQYKANYFDFSYAQ